MRSYFLILGTLIFCRTGYAQYFQFSQINYTDQRINPAMVAATDYATLDFLFRNQATGGDFNLKSSFVSASYPFLSKRNGQRWSGIGVSLLDDRSGGIFSTQEAALSYAANIYLSRWQTLSLGVKGMYMQRSLDMRGLHTGMQYIHDRGFDESLYSGEDFLEMRNDFFTISLGGFWQQVDREKNRVAYAGFSFFDFNKPSDSFFDVTSELRSTMVGMAGFRAFKQGSLSVFPEVLITSNYANYVINAGAITRYEILPAPDQQKSHIDIITKYVPGRSGILGLQFHRENFSVGFSYDFPVIVRNTGNLGAFEVGLQLRQLVDPRLKARSARKKQVSAKPSSMAQNTQRPVQSKPTEQRQSVRDSVTTTPVRTTLKESIQHKQDSVLVNAQAGDIHHEPVELEKVTLHFNFEFNSIRIDGASADYLKELAEVLKENNNLRLNLIGHTDNVGSDRFNLRLSKQRAEAVKEYLVETGVDAFRIETDGRGMHEPLNNNESDEDRAKNRRVELKIIYSYE